MSFFEVILHNKILILRIGFLYFFARELNISCFKKKHDKYIWFFIVVAFGFFGYSIYLAHRRRLLKKRTFNPKFNPRN